MFLHDLEGPDTASWTQHAEAEQMEHGMVRHSKLNAA